MAVPQLVACSRQRQALVRRGHFMLAQPQAVVHSAGYRVIALAQPNTMPHFRNPRPQRRATSSHYNQAPCRRHYFGSQFGSSVACSLATPNRGFRQYGADISSQVPTCKGKAELVASVACSDAGWPNRAAKAKGVARPELLISNFALPGDRA